MVLPPYARRVDFKIDGTSYSYLLTPALELFRDNMLWFLSGDILLERLVAQQYKLPECIRNGTLYQRFRRIEPGEAATDQVAALFQPLEVFVLSFIVAASILSLFLVKQKPRRSTPLYLSEAFFGEHGEDALLQAKVHGLAGLVTMDPGPIEQLGRSRESLIKKFGAAFEQREAALATVTVEPFRATGDFYVNVPQLEKILTCYSNGKIESVIDRFRLEKGAKLFDCRALLSPQELMACLLDFIATVKAAMVATLPLIRDTDPQRIFIIVAHLVAACFLPDDQAPERGRFSLFHFH